MTTFIQGQRRAGQAILLCALLGVGACADTSAQQPPPQPQNFQAPPPVQPTQPAPTEVPPPPSATPPPVQAGQVVMPPQTAATPPAQAPTDPAAQQPGGQWTYTSQYGWIWMPYAQNYTYVAGDSGSAYEYAYYPSVGWTWLYAPWILGWGPAPYWGGLGPARFAWYSRPWFHVGMIHRAPMRWGGGFRGGGIRLGGGGHRR